jgi:hypothetical protein
MSKQNGRVDRVQMRRALPILLLLALVAAQGASGKAKPVAEVEGKDGVFKFFSAARGDGRPCLSYEGPEARGGTCFIAVGPRGGWALEAWPLPSTHDVLMYGATIRAARRVRFGKVASLRTGRYSKRFKVRFFAGLVPRRALRVERNRIVALDARGRLLGRQHYRDGHGGFGRCDGRWDRRHYCPKR